MSSTASESAEICHYTVLGIPSDATAATIRKAYRVLALELHPDRNPGNESRFKEICESYKVLSDPLARDRYDHSKRLRAHLASIARNPEASSVRDPSYRDMPGAYTSKLSAADASESSYVANTEFSEVEGSSRRPLSAAAQQALSAAEISRDAKHRARIREQLVTAATNARLVRERAESDSVMESLRGRVATTAKERDASFASVYANFQKIVKEFHETEQVYDRVWSPNLPTEIAHLASVSAEIQSENRDQLSMLQSLVPFNHPV